MVDARHGRMAGPENIVGFPTRGDGGPGVKQPPYSDPGPDRVQSRCFSCGALVLDPGRWCASCTAPLGSACLACHSINPRAASFCMLCGDKLPEIPACEALSPAKRYANERRHITMVFCDLVGSSALATSIDAEDFTEIIGAVLRRLTEVTERFGGFVAHYQGDGTLSSFGYPSANEDDTERAVRAALAMVEAVTAVTLPDGRRLAARVGISAGEVVVGDIVGMRRPRGLDMAGELPSLAARLQMVADPGAVVVDGTVFRTVGELFECRSLGERELKGWRFAVPVWQVLRPVVARNRFEAHERSRLVPLVGRTSEAACSGHCGKRPGPGTDGRSCCGGNRGSASHGWSPTCCSRSRARATRGCTTPAPRCSKGCRWRLASAGSNAPPGSSPMTGRRPGARS